MYKIILNVSAKIVYPIYKLYRKYIKRFIRDLRSAVIKRQLIASGASIGRDFVVGKNCVFRIKKGAIVEIGDNVLINDLVMINVRKNAILKIGNDVHINTGTRISSFERIEIGSKSLVASYCNMLDHDHKFDLHSSPSTDEYFSAKIILGQCVWLGTKVHIGKGVSLGDYSVIGAHSVVTKNIPPSCVAAGIPAKVIRKG